MQLHTCFSKNSTFFMMSSCISIALVTLSSGVCEACVPEGLTSSSMRPLRGNATLLGLKFSKNTENVYI